jgi:hypothetical protein
MTETLHDFPLIWSGDRAHITAEYCWCNPVIRGDTLKVVHHNPERPTKKKVGDIGRDPGSAGWFVPPLWMRKLFK